MEASQQAAADRHARKELQLREAMHRLQALDEQRQAQAAAPAPPDGRLPAAQARCDRAEARLSAQQAKTQQVLNACLDLESCSFTSIQHCK